MKTKFIAEVEIIKHLDVHEKEQLYVKISTSHGDVFINIGIKTYNNLLQLNSNQSS